MRSCCVPGCKTGGRMPSHGIPKNRKRRIEWLQLLKIDETDENEINNLRICYKHFKQSDYSCAMFKKRLIHTAVPSIDINISEDHTYAQTFTVKRRPTKIPEVDKIITDYDVPMQHEQHMKTLKQTVYIMKEDLQAHDQSIQELKEDMYLIKQEHVINQNQMRNIKAMKQRYVGTVTTKRQLPCTVGKVYNDNAKLRKETKRLKKRIADLKRDLKSKNVILNTKANQGRTDESTTVCQQVVDMILRNQNVAPQVKSLSSSKI